MSTNQASVTLYNTLTKSKEPFAPEDGKTVKMYNCGPTVYDRVHIGNLRAYVFADTLRRVLAYAGFDINQVMNITDVGHLTSDADAGEDKMMKGLKREGLDVSLSGMKQLADIYVDAFMKDIDALNIVHPNTMPRASEHIHEQIALIQKLEEKGFTYTTNDGVYFDTQKDPHYGKLGGLTPESEMQARVDGEQKRNPRDFNLWKFNSELGWESPWGKGFPGWHIECSAMSMKYLGETLDIHTGGIDHIPVHHNNEIAQSENATGKEFSRFWLHNAFLNAGDETKIAKSAGNALILSSVVEYGVSPLAYRYWLLTAHYRSSVNFSWDALEGGQIAFEKLKARLTDLPDGGALDTAYDAEFRSAIFDDLNTPQAISLVWDLLRDENIKDEDKKATILAWDAVLGLKLGEHEKVSIPDDVQKLLDARQIARDEKRFEDSDVLRAQIESKGFFVKDTPDGQKVIQS